MKNISIKIKLNPKFLNVKTGTRLALALVILFELYLAYAQIYKNISPEPAPVTQDTLVRVNHVGYQTVSTYLSAADAFVPTPPVVTNSNPFKYSQ